MQLDNRHKCSETAASARYQHAMVTMMFCAAQSMLEGSAAIVWCVASYIVSYITINDCCNTCWHLATGLLVPTAHTLVHASANDQGETTRGILHSCKFTVLHVALSLDDMPN